MRLGQYDEAIKQYEAALQSDALNNAVRLNLALAYYKSARPNDAIPQLKRVISSDPEAKNAYLILADCYLQTGQEKELVSLLKPREQMFGGDLSFAYLLGTALLRQDDVVGGQEYVDRVFGAGESAEAHLLLGTAQFGQHDYRAAKTELEAALKLNPKLPTANAIYGRTLMLLGEPDASERAYRRELEFNPNDFEANLQLGNLRKSAQRFAEASDVSRARGDGAPERPRGTAAARQPAAADRQQRRSGGDPRIGRQRGARCRRSPRAACHRLQPPEAQGRRRPGACHRRSAQCRGRGEAEGQARCEGLADGCGRPPVRDLRRRAAAGADAEAGDAETRSRQTGGRHCDAIA